MSSRKPITWVNVMCYVGQRLFIAHPTTVRPWVLASGGGHKNSTASVAKVDSTLKIILQNLGWSTFNSGETWLMHGSCMDKMHWIHFIGIMYNYWSQIFAVIVCSCGKSKVVPFSIYIISSALHVIKWTWHPTGKLDHGAINRSMTRLNFLKLEKYTI